MAAWSHCERLAWVLDLVVERPALRRVPGGRRREAVAGAP